MPQRVRSNDQLSPARLHELLHRADVIVSLAERSGTAIGYVSAVRKLHLWTGRTIIVLDDLYVRPGHRDGGVGQSLMTAMAAVEDSDDRVVRWEVETGNTAAQRFYARIGARLRTKTIAAWSPDAYRTHLTSTR